MGVSRMNRMIGAIALAWMCVFGMALGTPASAAETVNVTIDVFAASRSGSFDAPSKRYAKNFSQLGYKGARRIDTLTAKRRAKGSLVELKFKDPKGKVQTIKVRVVVATAPVRFAIAIPGYGFETTTTHKKQGGLLVKVPSEDLFLAVRP